LAHLNIVEGVLGRFLSFASFELPRFIGATPQPLGLLEGQPVADSVRRLPHSGGYPGNGVAMLVLWFRKAHRIRIGGRSKYFTVGTVVLPVISVFYFP